MTEDVNIVEHFALSDIIARGSLGVMGPQSNEICFVSATAVHRIVVKYEDTKDSRQQRNLRSCSRILQNWLLQLSGLLLNLLPENGSVSKD